MEQLLFNLNLPTNHQDEEVKSFQGKKSIRYAERDQIEFKIGSLDDLILEDHRARDVFEFVSQLDLSDFYLTIKISEGGGGPRTIDPKILLSLWLYAILEGIASARHIARLCQEHQAYMWICGGCSVNYHSLSDFRTKDSAKFRKILQESIAMMWKTGVFQPEEVAQDGTRVKANAGFSLYRREKTLDHYLQEANRHIEALEKELSVNPSAASNREKSARQRAVKERKERIEKAQNELKKYREEKKTSCKKNHHQFTQEDQEAMRVSIVDPESRKMKMGDGGFRLAYNVQFATSADKKVIVGVDVVNTLDPGTLISMMQHVKENLVKIGIPTPSKWLADSAYANKEDVERAERHFPDTTLYSPPTGNKRVDALEPRKTDHPPMVNLRKRMSSKEGQKIYKNRGCTAEFSNAVAKNNGMGQFLVRGLSKVKNMAMIYAITHNMMMYFNII